MIYKESFKNNSLAKTRLEYLLKLNPPEETAVPALYHLFKIYQKILPEKAKIYFDLIVLNYPDSPYAKILTNPEEFDQSDLQTPENVYQNLVKIYQKGNFDELAEKAESFRVVLSGTTFQPKLDLMMANYDGRLNGKMKWERSLKKVILKYPCLLYTSPSPRD